VHQEGFAGALGKLKERKNGKMQLKPFFYYRDNGKLNPKPSQPPIQLLHIFCCPKKRERENCFLFTCIYGRFLMTSRPTIAIAMIIATTPTARYVIKSAVVAKPVTGTAVGTGVGASLAKK
jgi:hypothetical protein